MDHILVVGGSGFVGQRVVAGLCEQGFTVTVTTRDPQRSCQLFSSVRDQVEVCAWEVGQALPDERYRAVVNLAGAGIADKRWSSKRRALLRSSRIETTSAVAKWAEHSLPEVVINASGVGFYANNGEQVSESSEAGAHFLATLCVDWEAALTPVLSADIRAIHLRLGVVLDDPKRGGALAKMLVPWQPLAPLGRGSQPLSWVHVDDVVGMIIEGIRDRRWSGPVNAVAPERHDNRSFTKILARAADRWCAPAVPAWILRLRFGQMADLLLRGDHVTPTKATSLGYDWRWPELEPALQHCLQAHDQSI